jgi:molecular chaperone DnaK (HSP70)
VVAVKEEPEDEDGFAQRRWGHQVSPDEEDTFRWFKLGFVHAEYLEAEIRESTALTKALEIRLNQDMKPTDVTKAYLRGVWAHAIRQAVPILQISQEQLRDSTIHAVVGVPANWSPETIETLREAFKLAGIPGNCGDPQFPSTLNFIPEPEAAILSVIQDRALSRKLKVFMPPLTPKRFTSVAPRYRK